MNELVIKDTSTLTPVEIRMDQESFPRLKNIPSEKAVNSLALIVGKAFMYTGRYANDADIAFIATNLYNELLEDERQLGMKEITIEEIWRCIKRSVLGQGSKEMFGISVASLYAIIAEYCKGEGHMASIEASRRLKKRTPATALSMADNYAKLMLKK